MAVFAILLQSLIPVLHHPAGMALAAVLAPTDIHNLCLAPGSAPVAPDKAPARHPPACAICQAVHAVAGFAPPAAPALGSIDGYVIAFAGGEPASQALRPPSGNQQPRAPPVLV